MQRTRVFVPCLSLILIVCLLIAGCSSPETTNQTAENGTTTTTPAAGAQYVAGDVVKNPSSTGNTAWLVLGYNPASDTYERALIYSNESGGWGYRTDNRTEKTSRFVMEKVYTENLGNIDPSSVPIVTPTIITPVETTQAAGNFPVSTVTTTNTATWKPDVQRSIPDKGVAGTTVKITQLVGANFLAGANVTLSRSGYATINAYNVKVESPKSLTCSFDIPASAPAGTYDLTVKNPNGLSGTFTNYFNINRDTSVVTTTISTRQGTLDITYIDPPSTFAGYREYTITGSKFQTNAKVSLRSQSGKPDIEATDVRVESETQLRCFISIPKGSFGTWDLIVTNPDGTYGAWLGGLTVG